MRYPPFRWRVIGLLPWQSAVALVLAMTHPLVVTDSKAADVAPPPVPVAAGPPVVPRILSLPEARQLARRHAPSLRAAAWASEAADARLTDAGRRENPTLGTTYENWGGSLPPGLGELTLDLTQSFDLGGDRRARRGVALGERDLARVEWWSESFALDAHVCESFLDAWLAHERVWNARAARTLAMELLATVNDRVKAGAASVVERARAEAHLALRSTELMRAEGVWNGARRGLVLSWGAPDADIDSLVLPQPPLSPPAPIDSLTPGLGQHPEVLRARAVANAAGLRVRAAHAARVPDLVVRFGARRFSDAGDAGFVAGVGIPIPVWNRGSGTLIAAEADRSGAELRVRAAQLRLGAELRSAHERVVTSASIWREITEQALPAVEAAFDALRGSYRMGRIGYVDVLDGQRAAIETRLLALDAARDAWSARLDLERFTNMAPRGQE